MASPKKKGNNDYINMTFQHATPCKTRLRQKKKRRRRKLPRKPTALDAILAQCGFYLHPITHKHPNVTLSLELLLSSM